MARVGWLALSVGFLALYVAFSINQALSNGVEDIDGCESFQPIYGRALLHHVYRVHQRHALRCVSQVQRAYYFIQSINLVQLPS